MSDERVGSSLITFFIGLLHKANLVAEATCSYQQRN